METQSLRVYCRTLHKNNLDALRKTITSAHMALQPHITNMLVMLRYSFIFKMMKRWVILFCFLNFNNLYAQQLQFSPAASGKFTVRKLAAALANRLTDSCVGWCYEIRQHGKVVASKAGGYSITAVDNNGKKILFTNTIRMHVASVSKTITAIAVAKLVDLHLLSFHDPIKKYLPASWIIDTSFAHTTIKDLLTMVSGIDGTLDAAASCYDSLKWYLQKGIIKNKVGIYTYQNTSYGLLRIIIANAFDGKGMLTPMRDEVLALKTGNIYTAFINKYLLSPCGVAPAACREQSGQPVLMYPFPYNKEHGYLSGRNDAAAQGDLTPYAGGLGWYLSSKELGSFLNAVFTEHRILSSATLNQLIGFRFPFKINTVAFGSYFGSGGDWMAPQSDNPRGGVHAYYYFFPGNIQVVVFTNSGSYGLRDVIVPAFSESCSMPAGL